LSLPRPTSFFEPLVVAIGSFRRLLLANGTPSSSASERSTTSLKVLPERAASAWIASLSSSGMRRRRTGLEPGSVLLRPVGRYEIANDCASSPTATSLSDAPRRAVSRTSAPFKEEGALTRTPFLVAGVLAVKVLAIYYLKFAMSSRDSARRRFGGSGAFA